MAGIDNYVKLLLHMDGADDGTVFTDSSLQGHILTRYNAVTKTAIRKFGSASGYFDGSGDYLTAPASNDWSFGTGDVTVDFWFRRLDTSTSNRIISQYTNNDNRWYIHVGEASSYSVGIGGPGQPAAAWSNQCQNINQWYHVAIVREGNNFELFVDGLSQGIQVSTSSFGYSGQLMRVGVDYWNSAPNAYAKGYIEELRISKGIARWTENFTPPIAAYSNYEVSGNLSDDSRIIMVDDLTGDVEYNNLVSAGAYVLPAKDGSEKSIVAFRTSDGKAIGYGKVIPISE
jgi:hypothetical protein